LHHPRTSLAGRASTSRTRVWPTPHSRTSVQRLHQRIEGVCSLGLIPRTTVPVVAEVSRSSRQVQLRRMLRGCDMVGFSPDDSHEVGAPVGKASTSDVVDAHLAILASRRQATVLTSDIEDLRHLSDQLPTPGRIQRI
jgi:hypothetical protein